MRDDLLDLLCCPHCRQELDLRVFRRGGDEVVEGLLACRSCQRAYPIEDGIPHLLPNALAQSPGFAARHADALASLGARPSAREIRRFERLQRRTAEAFGYEWNRYRVTTPEEDLLTLCFLTGIDPTLYKSPRFADVFSHRPEPDEIAALDTSFVRGKRVLEVGCGMGKYVRAVAEHGGIAVGLDLSRALSRARRDHGSAPGLHWVRGDILAHPFREGIFDFAYSVGVLHHTPDCRLAFANTASLVKEGGDLAVWLYPSERSGTPYARLVHLVQDSLLRPVTTRLPHDWLYQLCRVLGRMTFLRDEAARRGHTRLAQLYALVAVGAHRDPEIAAFLNFDWYSPQYRSYHSEDELLRWYRDAGYRDVRILPQRTSGIGRRASRAAVPPAPPAPRVHANVEAPGEEAVRRGASLVVGGWAFEALGRGVVVRVYLDGRLRRTLGCFEPRLDVKAAFAQVEHALYAGFHTRLRVPRSAGRRLVLRVTFATEDHPEPLASVEREVAVEGPNALGAALDPLARRLPAATARRLARSPLARRLTGRQRPGTATTIPPATYRRWIECFEATAAPPAPAETSRLGIVAIGRGSDLEGMRILLDSVTAGPEPAGLCAVVTGEVEAPVAALLASLPDRVPASRWIAAPAPGDLGAALASAAKSCPGDFIVFVGGAALARHGLARVARAVADDAAADVVYGDHDVRDAGGERREPSFVPGFSPERLLVDDYLGPVQAWRRSLLDVLGAPRAETSAVALYDLALRAAERGAAFVRVPHVLGHAIPGHANASPSARRRCAQAALDRRGASARVVAQRTARTARLTFEWPEEPSVAVVIPTRDRVELLERCVTSVERRTRYRRYEIVIVNDRSRDPRTLAYLARTPHRVVEGDRDDRFDFAALVNRGARATRADYLILLNNDVEVLSRGWMHELVGYGRIPGVGAVGAKLLYPDGRIQHAGIVLGHEGLTGHYFQGEADSGAGYADLKRTAHNVSAVTAACLLTPRELFLELGGFDARHLPVAWNDVDYCLRLRERGLRCVMDPHAVLVHHEAASRGDDKDEGEIRYVLSRWQAPVDDDPCYHPAFSRTGASYRLCLDREESRRHHYRAFHRGRAHPTE